MTAFLIMIFAAIVLYLVLRTKKFHVEYGKPTKPEEVKELIMYLFLVKPKEKPRFQWTYNNSRRIKKRHLEKTRNL